jgi:hypothetical protein
LASSLARIRADFNSEEPHHRRTPTNTTHRSRVRELLPLLLPLLLLLLLPRAGG